PVQWNRSKWVYDAVMLLGVFAFLWIFLYVVPEALTHERPINPQIVSMRAFGACAFVMLSIILAIGPLARLDGRFLPLLYNRRHFGVMACAVALSHAYFVLGWYFSFSRIDRYEAALLANTSYGQLLGFPFEAFGIFALICLFVLATTSHDFWLKFLTPPVWKGLHYLIYPAYAAVVAHVALGPLQAQQMQAFTWIVVVSALAVAGLHLLAAFNESVLARRSVTDAAWIAVKDADQIAEGRARIVVLPDGDRVAVFRHEGKLSAVANACAHQNGPLGEGRILECLVTCPWHGFQYDVTTGQSPAPFTEKIPTYRLKRDGGQILVHRVPNPPGTYQEPLGIDEPDAAEKEATV
ncbi:MAG: Rieske 2Fe-2S domain-containing protein, partial [Pseudomonadota bacterium]